MQVQKNKEHFYWLDLIRFLAAFCVVTVHTRGEVLETYSLLEENSQNLFTQLFYFVNSWGGIGVLVFFVLSGFLVGGRTAERILKGTADFYQYAIDRSVRIGLPLVGSLILIIIVNSFLGMPINWLKIIGNLFSLQGIFCGDVGGVFWTLSYEVWFYVLFASLILLLRGKYNYLSVIGLILFTMSLCAFVILDTYLLFVLLCGVMGYFLAKSDWKISKKGLFFLAFMFFALSSVTLISGPSRAHSYILSRYINTDIMKILIGLVSMLFISGIIRIKPSGVFGTIEKYGTVLAKFSYSLYLTHWQVLKIINHFFGRSTNIDGIAIGKFVLSVFSCIIFAYLFYLLTERNTTFVKNLLKR